MNGPRCRYLGAQTEALIDRSQQPGFLDKLGINFIGIPMTDQALHCRLLGMRA
ncbi:hypothetical protein GGR57DRAFT_73884 [Xylariaceae sp. FL1272]|nr:hypothetical protein GGR57DRAFT_73884 [Xylariaceae sp. FL1272]